MTNIIAIIIITVTTNWVTVSRTSPVVQPGSAMYAVMRYDQLNQTGARVTNTVARFVWKGKTNDLVLEHTQPFYEGDINRTISEAPFVGQW